MHYEVRDSNKVTTGTGLNGWQASGPRRPLVEGPGNQLHPSLSPDGRWLAYASVPVHPDPGVPEPLWTKASVFGVGLPYGKGYDVTSDGRQVLLSISATDWSAFLLDLRILFNWFDELERHFDN